MFRLLIVLILTTAAYAGECVSIEKAFDKLGEVACIKGRVLKVTTAERSGTWFLNFCEDYRTCPFTVVVFSSDLRDVGDIRTLEGKEIQISGKVKSYNGQPEIILRDRSQLRGEFANVPKLPKDFDTTRRGSYSAGKFKSPKRSTTSRSKKAPTDKKNPDLESDEE